MFRILIIFYYARVLIMSYFILNLVNVICHILDIFVLFRKFVLVSFYVFSVGCFVSLKCFFN